MRVAVPLLLTVVLWSAASASAAPGELDPSFGSGGTLTTSFGAGDDFASDVIALPDGRLVVVGSTTVGGQADFALARYLPNGQLDPSFSGDGRATLDFSPGDPFERAASVAAGPDGKIIVAGRSEQFAVARFNDDGSLDTTFSDDGRQTVEIGDSHSSATDVAIDPRGRIVLVGVAASSDPISNLDAAYARLTPDGTLDTSFAGTGMRTEDLTYDGGDDITGVAPLGDGGFLVVGGAAHLGHPGPELVATGFTEAGAHTPGFGESRCGRAVVAGLDVQRLPDGRFVIAGAAYPPASVGAVRLLPDGRYDPSFSGDGEDTAEITASTELPAKEIGTAVAGQPNGRIVVGVAVLPEGGAGHQPTSAFGLVRFRAGGGLDASFDGDGRQATRIGAGASLLRALALQGPERIVAAGTAGLGTGDSDFALARYDGGVVESDPPGRAANRAPDSNIRRPGRRLRGGRPFRVRGTASDDAGLAKVEIALLRLAPARRNWRVCRWLRGRRPKFSRTVMRARRSCVRSRRFVRAAGTARWRYRLPRGLPAGRYVLFSRATDTAGVRERRFSRRDRNRVVFRVRRPVTRP